MANDSSQSAQFFCTYNLIQARGHLDARQPQTHQHRALQRLQDWYAQDLPPKAGGILVLPTGGGKTFTAQRFLARKPLSDGYKVLWLAHTHHLLEQAYESFGSNVAHIAEPRNELSVRVVSGTPGHLPSHTIKATDDVIIGTLQTLAQAEQDPRHDAWRAFLESCNGKLFVVFDEAHHSPAPTYRRFIQSLRQKCGQMRLLGLTATPYYSDENKAGWLRELFPQEILFQVTPASLIAANVLARPVIEEPRTHIEANFDDREYEKWVGTNRDLPEELVTDLAKNQSRNEFIVRTYLDNRARYGKTIIFADRWAQCEFLSVKLNEAGVRAGSVYSHVEPNGSTVEARNRRDANENKRVLEAFRAGELDVLLNVKMLTEGTDIPKIQSVFLTRQTTSKALMTQMVGRALRGPQFGGTSEAYVVSFIDNWRQLIHWAAYDELATGGMDDTTHELPKRPPLQLISIELVRNLARMMDSGQGIETVPFLKHLPIGWYQVNYLARVKDSDDMEDVRRLVMVFEEDAAAVRTFVEGLHSIDLAPLANEGLFLADHRAWLAQCRKQYWSDDSGEHSACSDDDLFGIVRHIAQHRTSPRFFEFEERDSHNLDELVIGILDNGLGPRQIDETLRQEYNRSDRFWGTLYWPYRLFKSQFDACMNRALEAHNQEQPPETYVPSAMSHPELMPEREPSDDVKRQVKERDQKRCVCCGETSARLLTVDHISSWYHGGSNLLDNLQTLCRTCNQIKGTDNINFRDPQTDLRAPLARLRNIPMPSTTEATDSEVWERYIRRVVNFYYRCNAVHNVQIASRGKSARRWQLELLAKNPVNWLEPHLAQLLEQIRQRKTEACLVPTDAIVVSAPDQDVLSYIVPGAELVQEGQGESKSNEPKPLFSKRQLLDALTVATLREVATNIDLDLDGARRKDELIDVVARSRRASIEEILEHLSMADLRQLCSDFGLDHPVRTKEAAISVLLGQRIGGSE